MIDFVSMEGFGSGVINYRSKFNSEVSATYPYLWIIDRSTLIKDGYNIQLSIL